MISSRLKAMSIVVFLLDGFLLLGRGNTTAVLQPLADTSTSVEITADPSPTTEPTTEPTQSVSPVVEPSPTMEPSVEPSPTYTPSPGVPSPTTSPRTTFTPVLYPPVPTWEDWVRENFETINYINDSLQNSSNIGSASYRGWQYGLELTKPIDDNGQALLDLYMYDIELTMEEWAYHEYDAAIARFNKSIDEWNRFLQYVTTA